MKPDKDKTKKAKAADKKAVSDYLVARGLSRGSANQAAKTIGNNATYKQVAESVLATCKGFTKDKK